MKSVSECIKKVCYACDSHISYRGPDGVERWRYNRDIDGNILNILCQDCYNHLFISRNRIEFLGKSIHLSWNPKKDVCVRCKRSVMMGEVKYTTLHHLEYFIIFPWFATIELCRKCHNIAHRPERTINKLGRFTWS